MYRLVYGVALLFVLVSCSNVPVQPKTTFSLEGRDYLYAQKNWAFSGRIAMRDNDNAISASITWQHQKNIDTVEIAGPLGVGRTQIQLFDGTLLIDDGKNQWRYAGENLDVFIEQQTGIVAPVFALQYWVLGLTDPNTVFVLNDDGFMQAGWQVRYSDMQFVEENLLPRKILLDSEQSRSIKLIINKWSLW